MDLTPEAKAARHLAAWADQAGRRSPRGIELQLDLTRRDIGTLLGLPRLEATLALNSLKRRGIISIVGSTVIILDEKALRSL